jgi:hypothetical protein
MRKITRNFCQRKGFHGWDLIQIPPFPPYIHSSFINGSTALLLGPDLFFSFVIFFTQTVGLLKRGISTSPGCYLHTGQHKHRHSCLEWNLPMYKWNILLMSCKILLKSEECMQRDITKSAVSDFDRLVSLFHAVSKDSLAFPCSLS